MSKIIPPTITKEQREVLNALHNAIYNHDGGSVIDDAEYLYDECKTLQKFRDKGYIKFHQSEKYFNVEDWFTQFLHLLEPEDSWCDFGNTISECIRILKEYKHENRMAN
jgi:hypothetical protein